jgi:hypothetical protein
MPQGYYTIEQWKPPAWVVARVLPFGLSLTAAEHAVEQLGQPGLYRLVHTQRIIWSQRDRSGLRLRKSHAASPGNLGEIQEMFDRTHGEYPVEEAKAARRKVKRKVCSPKAVGKRK